MTATENQQTSNCKQFGCFCLKLPFSQNAGQKPTKNGRSKKISIVALLLEDHNVSGRHCRKQSSYRTNFLTQIPPNHFVQSAFIKRLDFLKEWLEARKTDILGGEMTLVKKPKNREDVGKSLFSINAFRLSVMNSKPQVTKYIFGKVCKQ